jgi:Inner centromere protein, ARK binding region
VEYPNIDQMPQSSAPVAYDSGRLGNTGDEMEVDHRAVEDKSSKALEEPVQRVRDARSADQQSELSDGRRTTEGSFHSARENVAKETPAPELATHAVPGSFPRDTPMLDGAPAPPELTSNATILDAKEDANTFNQKREPERSPSSEGSTPEKPLVRKSSLNFASLPAREPLTTKKSIGHHTINMESKNQPFSRSSYFGRLTGGKSLGNVPQPFDRDEMDVDDGPSQNDQGSGTTKQHHKSYTQRLQDRINLLGKAPAPRPNKSIAHNSASVVGAIPQPATEMERTRLSPIPGSQSVPDTVPTEDPISGGDEEDDWTLPPLKTGAEQPRPQLSKSRSVDVMEQFAGKESVGGAQLGFADAERHAAKIKSPARKETIQGPSQLQYAFDKSASTTHLPSPTQIQRQAPLHQKAVSVSNPQMAPADAATPTGSPSRLNTDGHLSASKSKLQSIMRSARGLFTSSAGISAQAKLEALSPSSSRIRLGGIDEILRAEAEEDQQLYPTLSVNPAQTKVQESSAGVRKTRSSTQREDRRREQEIRERERVEAELAEAKDEEHTKVKEPKDIMEAEKPAPYPQVERSLENTSKPIRQSPRRLGQEDKGGPSEEPEAKPSQSVGPAARPLSQQSKTKETRRPVKPAAKPATKPPQVAIRVGTMRIPLTNNTLSSSLHDTLPPTGKQPGLTKKASNASMQTTASTQSLKSSTSGAPKPKSLVIAAQKKEQAEKEAQRKEEEKRERERKRAAVQEEAQRKEREQRQREEAERQKERERVAAEEAKRRAQKEVAEKRRVEATRKAQQSQQPQSQPEQKRAANDLVSPHQFSSITSYHFTQAKSVRSEQQRPPSRQETVNRPPSRMEELSRAANTGRPINPAKPIKRVFDPDNDDELSRPSRPLQGQNYQQTNDKRRRTGEEEEFRPINRPTFQPPKRQSNMRKLQTSISHDQGFGHSTHGGSKTSIFGGNHPTAPPPTHKPNIMNQGYAQGQGQPAYGPSTQPIRVGHPMDMAKYQSGKIPFAEAPNPPAQAMAYKTPLATHKSIPNTNKSSPMYTNGENIHLDEIATDSEDEDSEDERDRKQALPDWVRTPNLFEHLAGQEELNPDAVFGPIAPLNMEEMFKDKSRHHRFRNRTSSANWFGTDRLTEDDIRQDHVAREKLRQDDGWTYGL